MITEKQVSHNILAKVLSHLGESEKPHNSNSGPQVNTYLEYAGVDTSAPANQKEWCASFASYVVGMTLLQMGLPQVQHPVTPSSHEMVNWGIEHDTIITDVGDALPGDIVVLIGGNGEAATNGISYHHTTLLEWTQGSRVGWIGGNTAFEDTGGAVARGESDFSDVTIFRPYFAIPQGVDLAQKN